MKTGTLLIIIFIILSFLVCCSLFKKEKKDNFNDNSYIIKEGDFSSYKSRFSEKTLKTIDGVAKSSFIISYAEFSGTETIWHLENTGKSKLTLYFTSRINEGKIKGVIINEKNIVANVFSEDIKDGLTIGLNTGRYRIKLVGDKFSGKINMTILGEGDIKVYVNEK